MSFIKICGITNLADAKLSQRLGAKFLGFIFYKPSPRYINPQKASQIIKRLKPSVVPVAVFVNEPLYRVKKIAKFCGINILQLHGDETPKYCEALKEFKIIKAFRVKDKSSLDKVSRYKVSAFLFDTYSEKTYGGTGKSFDWKILKKKFKVPVFLSGGINARNVRKAIRIIRPYAIDISSSLEKYPGKKDPRLLRQFFKLGF